MYFIIWIISRIQMAKIIYPECNGETYLYEIIKPSGAKKPIHQGPGGIGRVLKRIKDFNDDTLIGIIDNDNSLPTEFEKYSRIDPADPSREINSDDQSKSGIKYYKHNSQNSYLIIQEPDLEGWLCKLGKHNDLFPKGSSINTPKKMKAITKQKATRLGRNTEFKKLIKAIELLPESPLKEIKDFIEKI